MNILLTGEVQTGKSTIIRRVTEKHPEWKIGGFVTLKMPGSFQVPENWPEDQIFRPDAVCICRAGKPLFSSDLGIVGDCGEYGFPKSFPDIFDSIGKRLAEDTAGYDLMIMDELGFLENEAELFQGAVFRTLEADVPVLGVLKKKASPFLDRIRSLPGVRIIEVTPENRDSLVLSVESEIAEAVEGFRKRLF